MTCRYARRWHWLPTSSTPTGTTPPPDALPHQAPPTPPACLGKYGKQNALFRAPECTWTYSHTTLQTLTIDNAHSWWPGAGTPHQFTGSCSTVPGGGSDTRSKQRSHVRPATSANTQVSRRLLESAMKENNKQQQAMRSGMHTQPPGKQMDTPSRPCLFQSNPTQHNGLSSMRLGCRRDGVNHVPPMTQGIDLPGGGGKYLHHKNRTAPKSQNVYIQLLAKVGVAFLPFVGPLSPSNRDWIPSCCSSTGSSRGEPRRGLMLLC